MMTDKTYQQITSRMADISKKHKLPSTASQMWTVLFKHQGANMTEEDEAFNEIERRAKQRMESVRVAVHTLTEYQRGYETGFIDGMQKQAQSSVDKAVNAMSQRTWVGLTDDEIWEAYMESPVELNCHIDDLYTLSRTVEAKLKEKNNAS
jgi:hypothetical protein